MKTGIVHLHLVERIIWPLESLVKNIGEQHNAKRCRGIRKGKKVRALAQKASYR